MLKVGKHCIATGTVADDQIPNINENTEKKNKYVQRFFGNKAELRAVN